MVDFSHYQKKAKRKATAIHTFHGLIGKPWIEVKRADRTNKKYFNAMLKGRTLAKQLARGGKMNDAVIAETEERQMELYAKYIVVRWGNVVDANKKKVPLNVESCTQFFAMVLAEDQEHNTTNLMDFYEFCTEPENFDEDDGEVDAEDAGKN